MTAPEKLDLASMDIAADRIAKLREDFRIVFRGVRIDFAILRRSSQADIQVGCRDHGYSKDSPKRNA